MPNVLTGMTQSGDTKPIQVDGDGRLVLADAPPMSKIRLVFYWLFSAELAVIIALLSQLVEMARS